MKRIALILAMIMLWGMSVASAEIIQSTDQFTGGKTYSSLYKPNEYSPSIHIRKTIEKNIKSYEIGFSDKTLTGERFVMAPIEIKIDDYPVKPITVKAVSFIPFDPFNKSKAFIENEAELSQEIIDQIKLAKRVALKTYKDKSTPFIIVLPDAVLAEWKQVISTEE